MLEIVEKFYVGEEVRIKTSVIFPEVKSSYFGVFGVVVKLFWGDRYLVSFALCVEGKQVTKSQMFSADKLRKVRMSS